MAPSRRMSPSPLVISWRTLVTRRQPVRSNVAKTYVSTLISTRRFLARPARVVFGAIGFSSP